MAEEQSQHAAPVIGAARRFLGLRGQTTIPLLALMLASAVTAQFLVHRSVKKVICASAVEQAEELAAMLALSGAPLAAPDHAAELNALCERIVQEHPVLGIRFSDADGREVAAARRADASSRNLFSPDNADARRGQRARFDRLSGRDLVFVHVCRPMNAPLAGGRVELAMDATSAAQAILTVDNLLRKLNIGLMAAMLPLTCLIIRRVVQRLNHMAAVARLFADGDLSPRVDVRGTDEIARLGLAFNAMADRLASSRADLLRMNAELEDRVQDRTLELMDLATRDPLTNVHNRRYFTETLGREFSQARRYDHDLAVMMIDLDNFKAVNDNHGHRTGDAVLILTANQIRAQLRLGDVAARYGGDEFIILLPHTPGEDAETVGVRIRDAVRRAAMQAMPGVPVDISVGIASLRATGAATCEELIQLMDAALYTVKRSGKGRVAHAQAKTVQPPAETPVAA